MKALFATIVLALSIAAHAAEPWRTVPVYDGLATVEVPAHWHEIPPDLLDFFAIRAAEMSGGRSAETYQHGFRRDSSEEGFALPQVLIQIRESGRIPYGQFLALPSPADVEFAAGDRPEGAGPFLNEAQLDDLSFDEERKVLLVNSTLDLAIEGITAVRSASFLTERGVFIVHCYDHAFAVEESEDTFERILSSVTFDESIRYLPHWRDRWTLRRVARLLFLAAGSALVVALLHRLRVRRRSVDSISDPGGPR